MHDTITDFSRYILPILAVMIFGLCLSSLFKRKAPYIGSAKLINKINGDCFDLSNREASIGRYKDCDILLNYNSVSRRHAVIYCSKDGWFIKGIKNSSPVIVNGDVVEKACLLKTNDRITLGEVTLIFENR